MQPNQPEESNNHIEKSDMKDQKSFIKNKWVHLLIGLIVVIAGGAYLVAILTNKDTEQATVYHDRPNFDRSKLSEAIGDPAPLVSESGGEAATYKNTKVIQACNLLKPEDLRQAGFELRPSPLTSFERTYFDDQGDGELFNLPTSLASSNDSNNCSYPLEQNKASIDVDVYQPAYSQPSAIDYSISRRFDKKESIQGLAVYEYQVDDDRYYLLRDGGSAVQLYMRKLTDEAKITQLVTKVAAAYKQEKASPAGPVQFVYDTPVFKKPYLNGCNITTAANIKQLFGVDVAPSPLITERIATATGVLTFTLEEDERQFSYIEHECVRRSDSESLSNLKSLTIETSSFAEEEGAKRKMASGRSLDDKLTELSATIGDDAYFSYTTGENPEMTIRSGRFIINIGIFDQSQESMDDQQMIELLSPVATSVAESAKAL